MSLEMQTKGLQIFSKNQKAKEQRKKLEKIKEDICDILS